MFLWQQKCWNTDSYRCVQSVPPSLTARVPRLHLRVCRSMPHDISLSPVRLEKGQHVLGLAPSYVCPDWSSVRIKKALSSYFSYSKGSYLYLFPVPFPFQWFPWNLEELISELFQQRVQSSFVWQGGSNSPNGDWQAGRQTGGRQRVWQLNSRFLRKSS